MNANRIRIALILAFILLALLGILYLSSQWILGNSYAALENQSVERNVGRAFDALQNDLDEINSKAGDWANWDDAYAFVQSGDLEFIKVNLTDVSLEQLKIDFIVFLLPSGKVIQAKAFDFDKKQALNFPPSFLHLLSDKQALAKILQNDPASSGLTGIVLTQEYPLLFTARPILTSDGTGPSHGTLIFARHLDALELERLSTRTHQSLSAQRLDSDPPSDDFRLASRELSIQNPIFIHANDQQTISGYRLVNDIFGQPAAILRVDAVRDIYLQGKSTIRYLMLVMFLVGIAFMGISQLLIDRLVLSRQFQRETLARYRTVIERAVEAIVIMDARTTRILEANPAFLKIFGYSANEISNLNLQELVADSGNAAFPETLGFKLLVGERRYQRKDGTQLDVEANASLISQNSHSVVSVIMRDVTARNRTQREVQQKAEQFSLLYDAGIALNSQLEPHKAVENLLNIVSKLVRAERAVFFRYDSAQRAFRFETGLGLERSASPNLIEQTEFSSGEPRGIIGLVAEVLVSIYIPDLNQDPRWINTGSAENSGVWTPVLRGSDLLGVLVVTSTRIDAFGTADQRLITLLANQLAVALENARLFNELESSYLQTVLALARAVDAKDDYTADHSDRLAKMAIAVGQELGMKGRDLEDLHYGAILHDIGKIGVADSILKKPASLTAAEWVEMRKHPEIGGEILAPVPRLAGAAKIVRYHHERFDGKGYPNKLIGEAIPLGARILTVVDSYSAIVDERVYKKGRSQAEAVAELVRCTGTQFDARVVQILLEWLARGDSPAATLQNEPILATAPILADLRLLVDD